MGSPARRKYIDWARGLAVLIMVEAHTLDAWTRLSDRSSTIYGYLLIFGGLAAPLFLWLAGVGLAVAAERAVAAGKTRTVALEAVVRRGTEIFLLAFLFRLQAFIVSPGSWPITLFRVDILNIMGPSIAVAGLIWGFARGRRAAVVLTSSAAVLVAMVTPILRRAEWVGLLPTWFQWYIRPAGDHTTFVLFPWAGFVFAGASCGCLIASTRDIAAERRLFAGIVAAGALMVGLGFYGASLPTIYQASSFWTSSPTYFAIRVGGMMVLLAALYFGAPITRWLPRATGILEILGRNSLFIYWIHVELVYGYASWVIRRKLPLLGTLVAFLLFCGLLYVAILFRDRVVRAWKDRKSQKTAQRGALTAGI